MKMKSWPILILLSLIVLCLFAWLCACGGTDDVEEDDTPTPEPEEELPLCEFDYPDAPPGEGTVTVDGLEWTKYDTGEGIDQHCAQHYVADLDFDGKTDWRLPTIEELATLYDNTSPQTVPCNVMSANINASFIITCYVMWTNEVSTGYGSEAYNTFSFAGSADQKEGSSNPVEYDKSANQRVLAVRDL